MQVAGQEMPQAPDIRLTSDKSLAGRKGRKANPIQIQSLTQDKTTSSFLLTTNLFSHFYCNLDCIRGTFNLQFDCCLSVLWWHQGPPTSPINKSATEEHPQPDSFADVIPSKVDPAGLIPWEQALPGWSRKVTFLC